MKHLLLFCLLLLNVSACSDDKSQEGGKGSVESLPERAIHEYMKQTMNDPASYEPGSIHEIGPFMRSDSANLAGMALMNSNVRQVREKGYALIDGPGKDTITLIGMRYTHQFRAKNAMGGLVLDSALFVVYKTGKVGAWPLR